MTQAPHLIKQAARRTASGAETHGWDLTAPSRRHRVEIVGSMTRTITWYVDDQLVAMKKSSQDDVRLEPGEGCSTSGSTPDESLLDPRSPDAPAPRPSDDGTIRLRFTGLGLAKRVTWYQAQGDVGATARALVGAGGIDFDPEPGSPAAMRAERIRLHPRRYAALASPEVLRRW